MNDLPNGWVKVVLGEVIDYGKTIKIEPTKIPDNAWLLELEDIEKDTSQLLQRLKFAERDSKSTKNYFVKGDVLYGKLRPYLNKVLIADRDGYCTTEIIPLKPNIAIDGRYLFYWLKHPEFLKYVDSVSHGIQMPRLGTESGLKAPIVLAPVSEQQRIVAKLDRLFAHSRRTREELEHIPKLIKRYKQAVLLAGTSGEFSENCKTVDIQSIAKVGTGSTPLKSNSGYYSDCGTPWITSAATGQQYVNSASEFVTDSAILDHRLKKYPVGTILVAMYGEGKTRGQVTELRIEATINQACAAIVIDESLALKEYVKLSLQANYLEMRELAEGGNQPNLNLSKIKNFTIVLPSLEEQKEIVRRVEKMFKSIESIEEQYQQARQLCDRLEQATLAKAFRGELVPQDPNDEPASVLLERICAEKQQPVVSTGKKSRRKTA